MKIVILNASPRKEGNTSKALQYLLERYKNEDITSFDLVDYDIEHCSGCLNCSKTGKCIFNDDMDIIYDAIDAAELLIFTTPVYFNSVTSIGKQVIDRFQRNYARRFILKSSLKVDANKKGILLATAGSKEKNHEFDGLRKPIDLMFKANGIREYEIIIIENADMNSIKNIF
ncbi:MAG: flavodoxin family protein [Bacillota bacterium]|nr:flavodoxin family protein [Bacillota bacterium]